MTHVSVYRCDRCGVEYREQKHTLQKQGITIDLCPVCSGMFDRFMAKELPANCWTAAHVRMPELGHDVLVWCESSPRYQAGICLGRRVVSAESWTMWELEGADERMADAEENAEHFVRFWTHVPQSPNQEANSVRLAGDHCGPGNECGRLGCEECQR